MYLYKRIIEAFNIDSDPIKIARRFSFKDQYEMYDYMGKEGYIWNSDIRNYERSNVPYKKVRDKKTKAIDDNFLLDKYIDLLEDLYRERETRLTDKSLDCKCDENRLYNRLYNSRNKNKDIDKEKSSENISHKKIFIESKEYKVDLKLANRLENYCRKEDVSISVVLNQAIRKYLEENYL